MRWSQIDKRQHHSRSAQERQQHRGAVRREGGGMPGWGGGWGSGGARRLSKHASQPASQPACLSVSQPVINIYKAAQRAAAAAAGALAAAAGRGPPCCRRRFKSPAALSGWGGCLRSRRERGRELLPLPPPVRSGCRVPCGVSPAPHTRTAHSQQPHQLGRLFSHALLLLSALHRQLLQMVGEHLQADVICHDDLAAQR